MPTLVLVRHAQAAYNYPDRARTKTWLACEEHLSYLEGYFKYRSFPYEVSPFVAPTDGPSGDENQPQAH